MSRQATLLLGILRRHFTNRVLPACLIYRNPEGEASCSVHLSRSARRNYAAMTSRTAERLLNSIKAALFPTLPRGSLIYRLSRRSNYGTRVFQYNKLRSNFEDEAAWSPSRSPSGDIHGISILYREIISERNVFSNKWPPPDVYSELIPGES